MDSITLMFEKRGLDSHEKALYKEITKFSDILKQKQLKTYLKPSKPFAAIISVIGALALGFGLLKSKKPKKVNKIEIKPNENECEVFKNFLLQTPKM